MKTTLLCSFCDDAIDIGDTAICKNCVDELHKNIKKLQARIAELEKYRIEGVSLKTIKAVNESFRKKITKLQAENAKLRASVVWHKYQDEKPDKQGWYLTSRKGEIRMHFWLGDRLGFDTNPTDIPYVCQLQPHYWAYLPEPPREEK